MHISLLTRIVGILAFVVWAFFFALSSAVDIPTEHLDGSFQTASGLFRLDSGQAPGKDFFPYLGVGPLLAIYPAFKLFGATLAASVFSAHLMTILFGWLSVSILWQLVFKPRSLLTAMLAGAAFLVATILAQPFTSRALFATLHFVSDPGNSLRPIRIMAPYLLMTAYYVYVVKLRSDRVKSMVSGLITGLILLWSNDFAIPSAILFAILFYCHGLRDVALPGREAAAYLACAATSWLLFLSLGTLGHPIALLKYNFFDVATDQWWFFGPYGEETRIFEADQILRLISTENLFPLIVLMLTVLVAIRSRLVEDAFLAWLGVVLLTGGVLASVGGHLGGYFGGFYFWALATSMMLLLKTAMFVVRRYAGLESHVRSAAAIGSGLGICGALIVLAVNIGHLHAAHMDDAKTDNGRFYVPELGGYLNSEWRDYIALARQSDARHVVEEYWGIWSATRRIFPPWPVDSVIHALGHTRDVASAALKDADVMITTRNSASEQWQPWNLSQNFWFYDELLANWTPSDGSPRTIVWHKNRTSRLNAPVACRPSERGNAMMMDIPKPGFYRLEFAYRFAGKGRHLLMVRNNFAFGADAEGYVSINPAGSRAVIPVYFRKEGPASLDLRVTGSPEFTLNLSDCNVRTIEFANNEILHVPDTINESFLLTDGNWVHGVSRYWPGFFVPNNPYFVEDYRPGARVRFASGQIRSVLSAEKSDRYLNIHVDGPVLDPAVVGTPASYKPLAPDLTHPAVSTNRSPAGKG